MLGATIRCNECVVRVVCQVKVLASIHPPCDRQTRTNFLMGDLVEGRRHKM